MKIGQIFKILPALFFMAAPLVFPASTKGQNYSPHAVRAFPDVLLWGDTHVHTNLSSDAYGGGNNLTPDQAYRFARGERIVSNTGQPARLSRPLDFLVVTDHAEYLGVASLLDSDREQLVNSEIGQRWLQLLDEDNKFQILMDGHQASLGNMTLSPDEALNRSIWQEVANSAEYYNQPGKFTAFIGYEWTSLPDGNNLHRNVIFVDGADKVTRVLPFSALDSRDPEDLWRYLQDYEEETSGQVLAIPHNANVSNGAMFANRRLFGEPLDSSYAETRARWEPIVEITQIKGDGESHPWLSPDDEFANFETWDSGNFNLPRDAKTNDMLEFEYARSALKNGLALETALGIHPFKFRVIGRSDSHIAMSAVEEDNFFGKFGMNEPSAERIQASPQPFYSYAAAGFAAVWATENTRESIFSALKRREVYASTGPRISVRFFGGWNFSGQDVYRPDYAAIGYRKGVPMGSDLGSAPDRKSPQFLVVASKDPLGANLDRIQIVKGWLDINGSLHEKIYDIAWSGSRQPSKSGRLPAVGSTVDLKSATYTNTIGEPMLSALWEDPNFNAEERAFYYLRVLEIPTPRWSTYDSAFYGTQITEKAPSEIQERVYTSPIWYTPATK